MRDVILEANQHAEEEANAYILGESEEFPEDLWNRLDRFDVLEKIRDVNEELPDREEISTSCGCGFSNPPTLRAHC